MNDNIKFQIPAKAEYISTVRLLTSSIMANLKLNIEEIEDMKMAVAEACNIAIKLDLEDTINIQYLLGEDVKVQITGVAQDKIEDDEELSMSKLIINCLVDEVENCDSKMVIKKVLR